jgi:hypothetical protein
MARCTFVGMAEHSSSGSSTTLATTTPPVRVSLRFSVTYYHDGVSVRIDNDNLVKPIQDALNGLVYADDRQITDTYVRKTDLNGSFRVRGMSPVLAEGFCRGTEFLYLRVELAPDHEELI